MVKHGYETLRFGRSLLTLFIDHVVSCLRFMVCLGFCHSSDCLWLVVLSFRVFIVVVFVFHCVCCFLSIDSCFCRCVLDLPAFAVCCV